MKFNQKKLYLINVDVSASTEAFLFHVIDWDQAKVIGRVSNRVDRWIKEAIHIRKEQDKSMNRDEGSYQLSHIYDNLFAPKLSGEQRLDRPFRGRLQSKPKRQH